jgi:hypothetical protein
MRKRLPADAWFAGFFDGEGNVYVGERRVGKTTQFYCMLQVTQKRRGPLECFVRRFGGTISPTKTPSGCWRWRIAALQAQSCAEVLLPLVQLKNPQLVAMLKVRALTGRRGVRTNGKNNAKRRALRVFISEENHR